MIEGLIFEVGRKLRKLRGELGLSIRQVSEKAGVSPSTIQKIENNQISPTLGTILKIANSLGKEIHFFLDQGQESRNVVCFPKGKRRVLKPPGLTFTIHLLTEGLSDQRFSPSILTVPPGGKRGSHTHHLGEELQHCLRGKVEFTIQGTKYLLEEGDTIQFKSDLRHSWVNVGKGVAKLLMICSPPLYVGTASEGL